MTIVSVASPMTHVRLGSASLVLCSTLLVSACYESAFPIEGRPKSDIDRALPGTWRCLPFNLDPVEKAATITIAPEKGQMYAVTLREDGGEASRYEVFASSVAEGLMNVRELADGDKKPWMFVRATLVRPSVMQLQVLDKRAMPDTELKTADELRRAVERVRSKPDAFSDVCICVRVRQEKAGLQ
jgi:hypothetical protein